MPTPPAFVQAFPAYLANARTARSENRHHDYRRGLFLDLLRQAFGIRADEGDGVWYNPDKRGPLLCNPILR
jgi:hypothetical protein